MNTREREQSDDRDLMIEVRAGSRRAFALLVERYERRLIGYFFRQCGDRMLAEDCAQEVFVRLYRARHRYGPSASFATFLFTIARNYWIDVSRARRVRPPEGLFSSGSVAGDAEGLPAPERDPAEAAEQAEAAEGLRRALECLPQGQRDVVLLGVIAGLPYAEVAQVLQIPIGTVKSRVHAAVHALRGVLASPPSAAQRSVRDA